MRSALTIALLGWLAGTAWADDKPVASGPLKAFKGPEGELIAMLDISDGKEMLVHFKNLGGELEGKTLRYWVEDLGNGNKNIYVNVKHGSKTSRSNVLVAREGRWSFYHPIKNLNFNLSYSEQASQQLTARDVLKAYKP